MQAFTTLKSVVAPLNRNNVDTDAIIPKQFLKSIHRTGFGPYLFDEWRYLDHGEPGMDCSNRPLNPDFVLNDDRYKKAKILLVRKNFGCGSSREHAPWALRDYGFRAIIGASFADIFYNNCLKNGILPIVLDDDILDLLFRLVESTIFCELQIDLAEQIVTTPQNESFRFDIETFRKESLLKGLDEIGLTLQHADDIRAYEKQRRQKTPWLFK